MTEYRTDRGWIGRDTYAPGSKSEHPAPTDPSRSNTGCTAEHPRQRLFERRRRCSIVDRRRAAAFGVATVVFGVLTYRTRRLLVASG